MTLPHMRFFFTFIPMEDKSAFKDRFSEQAKLYSDFRPEYPEALYEFIFSQVHDFELALDCGTGNGQMASGLANRFRDVIATDISDKQLAVAVKKSNINYIKSPAELCPCEPSSVDLVTAAQAAHWFNQEAFYNEVNRILKPQGLLVLCGYQLPAVDDQTDKLLSHFYSGVLGPYWDQERKQVDNAYSGMSFPYSKISCPEIHITTNWNAGHYLGYLNTWSALRQYRKQNNSNPLTAFTAELNKFWKEDQMKEVRFPVFVIAGRKP